MMRQVFRGIVFAFLIYVAAAPSARAQAPDPIDASTFVTTMVHEFFDTLAGKQLSREERVRFLDHLIHTYGDIRSTSEALLGRSWGRATDDEQLQFQRTLVAYMLAMWSSSLTDVSEQEKIVVTGARPEGKYVLVRSTAMAPGEDPTYVEWQIGRGQDDRMFVADVSVEGVSMVRIMKSDFSSVLVANSGRLGGLIAGMQKKIDAVN